MGQLRLPRIGRFSKYRSLELNPVETSREAEKCTDETDERAQPLRQKCELEFPVLVCAVDATIERTHVSALT
jgi:hypothetical protein